MKKSAKTACQRAVRPTQAAVCLELAFVHALQHGGHVEQLERLGLTVLWAQLDCVRGQGQVVRVLHLGLPPAERRLVEVGDVACLLHRVSGCARRTLRYGSTWSRERPASSKHSRTMDARGESPAVIPPATELSK